MLFYEAPIYFLSIFIKQKFNRCFILLKKAMGAKDEITFTKEGVWGMHIKNILGILFYLAFAQLHAMSQANEFEEIEKSIHAVVQMLKEKPNERPEQSGPIYDLFKQAMDKINDLKYAYERGSFDETAINDIEKLLQQAQDLFSNIQVMRWNVPWHRKIIGLQTELKDSQQIRVKNKELAQIKGALPQGEVLLHNVAIIHGGKNESLYSVMVSELYITILQEAAPIIVHPRLFELLFAREKQQESEQSTSGKSVKETFKTFDERWHIYGVLKETEGTKEWARCLVLVPIAYENNLKKEFPLLPAHQLLGFNFNDATRLPLDFFRNNTAPVSYDELNEPASMIDCFLPKEEDAPNALWNISFSGHGCLRVNVTEEEEKEAAQCTQADLGPLFGDRKYNQLFDTRKFNSQICSLPLQEFKTFLEAVSRKLAMNFLTYSSCFAGGYNLYLPYLGRILNEEGAVISGASQPNFTIVVGSSTDAVVSSRAGKSECLVELHKLPPGCINFYKFFERLNVYTKNYLKGKTVQPARLTENELRDIMQPLMDLPKTHTSVDFHKRLQNMPLVMFPHTQKFTFLSLDPAFTFVLTEAKIKAAELEHKPITIAEMFGKLKKQTYYVIFMPVAQVPITLDLSQEANLPYIVSLLPSIGMHVIKEINVTNSGLSFMDCFAFSSNEFAKYFYIEKLHTHEIDLVGGGARQRGKPVTLSHVLIGVKDNNISMFFTDATKRIFFERHRMRTPRDLQIAAQGSTMEEIVGQYLKSAKLATLDREGEKLFEPLAILFGRYIKKKETTESDIGMHADLIKNSKAITAIDQEDVNAMRQYIKDEFLPEYIKNILLAYIWKQATVGVIGGKDDSVGKLMEMVDIFHKAGIEENESTKRYQQTFDAAAKKAQAKRQAAEPELKRKHSKEMPQQHQNKVFMIGGVPLAKPTYCDYGIKTQN